MQSISSFSLDFVCGIMNLLYFFFSTKINDTHTQWITNKNDTKHISTHTTYAPKLNGPTFAIVSGWNEQLKVTCTWNSCTTEKRVRSPFSHITRRNYGKREEWKKPQRYVIYRRLHIQIRNPFDLTFIRCLVVPCVNAYLYFMAMFLRYSADDFHFSYKHTNTKKKWNKHKKISLWLQ